jgi:Arc/MetJ-type ribon-helix-helix transcriptional regulator
MAEKTMRTHVVLPKELVEAVDELVGHRKRSAYIAAAIEAQVAHDRFGKVLKESIGILSAEDYPEWGTPEKVSAWVRELRNESDEATERKLSRIRQP